MSREKRRRGSTRRLRTAAASSSGSGRSIPMIPVVIVVGVIAVVGLIAFLIWQSGKEPSLASGAAAEHELDPAPDKAGDYVNLPEIYEDERGLATYASDGSTPNTAPHVTRDVDYVADGNSNPPAGGPHWGSGSCSADPEDTPRFCGPVRSGIYRQPWEASSLIHSMEHGGTVIWYNTTDQDVIDDLEDFLNDNRDKNLVLTPYPEMEAEHIAITVWSRIDLIPVSEYSQDRLDDFMDDWYCKFDPEGFC